MTDIMQELMKLLTSPLYLCAACSDFLRMGTGLDHPWSYGAIASGTGFQYATDVNKDHPGLIEFRSHASNPNSGYYFLTREISQLLGGGEWTAIVVKTPALNTNNRIRCGWMDCIDSTLPTDGVWIELQYDTFYGFTRSNGSQSQTEAICTAIEETWYRFEIELNADATSVEFRIYDDTGFLLGSEVLLTNIPTGDGRLLGHGILAFNIAPPGTYVRLVIMDFMSFRCFRELLR